jgi:hypothetical protein
MKPAVCLLAFLLLLPAGCDESAGDTTPPQVRWVFPSDGDTFDPGVYTVSAVATDDKEMRWVSFWVEEEMLGIVSRPRGDTYSLGVDCRADTHSVYPLRADALDRAGYNAFATVYVYIRR